MSDAFKPNPILPRAKKGPPPEPASTFVPPLTSLTIDPPPVLEVEDIGAPPEPHMSEEAPIFMTEATEDEIAAGKQASIAFEKRRKAELDYGRNFHARRKAITGG